MTLPDITIRRDLREKENKGWWFDQEEKKAGKVRILGTIEKSLPAGDYALAGFEDLIILERKMGMRELFSNYSPKEHLERFRTEMIKLKDVKFKYLIIESNLSEDILSLTVPQYSGFGPPGIRVVEWVYELQREFGIVPIWAGDAGNRIAKSLFKEIARKYL